MPCSSIGRDTVILQQIVALLSVKANKLFSHRCMSQFFRFWGRCTKLDLRIQFLVEYQNPTMQKYG